MNLKEIIEMAEKLAADESSKRMTDTARVFEMIFRLAGLESRAAQGVCIIVLARHCALKGETEIHPVLMDLFKHYNQLAMTMFMKSESEVKN